MTIHRRARHFRLAVGRPVVIRPITAADKLRLAAGFERLSPASRYSRFLGHVRALSEAQLTALTAIDHVDHAALDRSTQASRGSPPSASHATSVCASGRRPPRWRSPEQSSAGAFAAEAVVFGGAGDIQLDQVPEPEIAQATDAIVRPTWIKVEVKPAA